jgi:hypothetical protein
MLISAKNIIIRSIHLYKNNITLFLTYMSLIFIPLGISIVAGVLFTLAKQTSILLGILSISIMILLYISTLLITLSFIRVAAARYEGKAVLPITQELAAVKPLLLPAILGSILAGLAIIGGFFLLIIPGIIFSIWFAFVVYAIAIDEKSALDAMRASKALVANRWFAVFWRILAPGIVFGILVIAVEGLFNMILEKMVTEITPEQTTLYIGTMIGIGLLSSALSLLLTPLSTAAPIILYQELKKTYYIPPVQK